MNWICSVSAHRATPGGETDCIHWLPQLKPEDLGFEFLAAGFAAGEAWDAFADEDGEPEGTGGAIPPLCPPTRPEPPRPSAARPISPKGATHVRSTSV